MTSQGDLFKKKKKFSNSIQTYSLLQKSKSLFSHSPFSRNIHCHINEKSEVETVEMMEQTLDTKLQVRRGVSAWLVGDLGDDERDGVDGVILVR